MFKSQNKISKTPFSNKWSFLNSISKLVSLIEFHKLIGLIFLFLTYPCFPFCNDLPFSIYFFQINSLSSSTKTSTMIT
jgi:hypothetical protein